MEKTTLVEQIDALDTPFMKVTDLKTGKTVIRCVASIEALDWGLIYPDYSEKQYKVSPLTAQDLYKRLHKLEMEKLMLLRLLGN